MAQGTYIPRTQEDVLREAGVPEDKIAARNAAIAFVAAKEESAMRLLDRRATADFTVAPPRVSEQDLLIAAGAVGCPIISDGVPCDLQYGHRGRCWSR